jgi:hypothetical protein
VQDLGMRTYRVKAADFPLAIEVRASGLAANRAVIGSFRIVKNGSQVGRVQPKEKLDGTGMVRSYGMDKPDHGDCDVTHHIDGWFDSGATASARYTITITPKAGTAAQTTIRRPTLNPGVANLTFQVR